MTLRNIFSFGLILTFLAWCLVSFWSELGKIDFEVVFGQWHLLLLATLLSLANYVLRIFRWFFYLSRLGHQVSFIYSALTYIAGFAFTLSPGKVGEMLRGRYLMQVGVPQTSNAAMFFVERLLDLLGMLVLASVVATDLGHSELMWITLAVILAVMISLSVMPWRSVLSIVSRSHSLPTVIRDVLTASIHTLISAKRLLSPIALLFGFSFGLCAWGLEGVGLMVITKITHLGQLDVPTAIGIYAISIIVGALSFLPGGLGSTEVVMTGLLTAQDYPISEAILLTFICRFLTLWFAVLLGWIAVFFLRTKKAKLNCIVIDDAPCTFPLCVDMDGTLIKTDLLLETLLVLLKDSPWCLFYLPFWLIKGKAVFKAEIAKRVECRPEFLPYKQEFLEWLIVQKHTGRKVFLCTASNYRLANAVENHLGIFDGVIASSDTENLSGSQKAKRLVAEFGHKQFDYCGNHQVDCAIWSVSDGAVIVHGTERLKHAASNLCSIRAVFPDSTSKLKVLFRTIRLHQWAKNVLVFIPLLAAHKFNDVLAVQQCLIAFLSFGFCASSVYMLNDMLDLEADRQHLRKSKRPFAAGELSLLWGGALVPALLIISLGLASHLSIGFCVILGAYYLLTVAYSFVLKRLVLIDTISLAALYTSRIIAGAMAISVPLSFWLILFSIFLFFSLALVKRYAELDALQRNGELKAVGRGYHIEDLPLLSSIGTASGFLCVLVLALYINSPAIQALYKYPECIWLLCIIMLYWISRIWLVTYRGQMHDDPVVYALKDKTSLCLGLLIVLIVGLAI